MNPTQLQLQPQPPPTNIKDNELLICLKWSDLAELGIVPESRYIPLNPTSDLFFALDNLLQRHHLLVRGQAENNLNFAQVCVYTSVWAVLEGSRHYLTYRRSAKTHEQRLAAKRSVGWGGHVNSDDVVEGKFNFALLNMAAMRELDEELPGMAKTYGLPEFKGLILSNDDAGKVHIGFHYSQPVENTLFNITQDKAAGDEQEWRWQTLHMTSPAPGLLTERRDFELWSQILMQDALLN